jgi:hypothetical protein
LPGAYLYTFAAADAALLAICSLDRHVHAFRIMAPSTCQRATLEKNGGPNSRSIMNGVFFDIKDNTGNHNAFPLID